MQKTSQYHRTYRKKSCALVSISFGKQTLNLNWNQWSSLWPYRGASEMTPFNVDVGPSDHTLDLEAINLQVKAIKCLPPWCSPNLWSLLRWWWPVRFTASGLLLTSAYAACLDDAIPKSSRKTLVNENGETYPVGFFISNYAASYAANILVSTLVEAGGGTAFFFWGF